MKSNLNPINAIEMAMDKLVPMEGVAYSRNSIYQFDVTWGHICDELMQRIHDGLALSDTAKHVSAFVAAAREHIEYMQKHDWKFDGLTAPQEAAEHITLFALCKIGIASLNADPQPFIRAALTSSAMWHITTHHEDGDLVGGDHLLEALFRAGTAPVTNDGEDELQPDINVIDLLLDDRHLLDEIVESARRLTRDPQWVADEAVLWSAQRVLEREKKGATNGS